MTCSTLPHLLYDRMILRSNMPSMSMFNFAIFASEKKNLFVCNPFPFEEISSSTKMLKPFTSVLSFAVNSHLLKPTTFIISPPFRCSAGFAPPQFCVLATKKSGLHRIIIFLFLFWFLPSFLKME